MSKKTIDRLKEVCERTMKIQCSKEQLNYLYKLRELIVKLDYHKENSPKTAFNVVDEAIKSKSFFVRHKSWYNGSLKEWYLENKL